MKERPILFSGAMVQAILAGTKTQTRRIVKDQDPLDDFESLPPLGLRPQYGEPGDRLWVRETFFSEREEQAGTGAVRWSYRLDGRAHTGALYRADGNADCERWKPSIFMPRCLSRIVLDVTAIRVERLQAISEEDARAEGVDNIKAKVPRCRDAYETLWDAINGKRAPWASNPWVWVVEFARRTP